MSKIDNARNLDNIRRIDQFAKELIEHCNHAALFEFSSLENRWLKTKTDGPLFIYQRLDHPLYSLMIANRQSLNDFIEPITESLNLKYEPPYIFIHREDGNIRGVWVYGEDDCKRVFNTLIMLRDLQKNQKQQQTKGTPLLTFPSETKHKSTIQQREKPLMYLSETEQTSITPHQREKPQTFPTKAEQTKSTSQQEKPLISSPETEYIKNTSQQKKPPTLPTEAEQTKSTPQTFPTKAEQTKSTSQQEKPLFSSSETEYTKNTSQQMQPPTFPTEAEQIKSAPQREKLSLSPPPYQDSGSMLRPVTYGDLLRLKQELKQELMEGFHKEMEQMVNTFKAVIGSVGSQSIIQ